jgi:hypothetical protein
MADQRSGILTLTAGFEFKENEQAEYNQLLTKTSRELLSIFEREKWASEIKVAKLNKEIETGPIPFRSTEKLKHIQSLYKLWDYIKAPIPYEGDIVNEEAYIKNLAIIIEFIFRRFQRFIPDNPVINVNTSVKLGIFGSYWQSIIDENKLPNSLKSTRLNLFSGNGLILPVSVLDKSAPNINRGPLKRSPLENRPPNKPRGTRKPIPLRNNKQTFKNKIKNLLKQRAGPPLTFPSEIQLQNKMKLFSKLNKPLRKVGKLDNLPQDQPPRFLTVAPIARQQLGGPRPSQTIGVRGQLPRLNNLMPNTSRRARNTRAPGNTTRVIQTGVPRIRPSYANMARGVPLSPAPFPLSPLVSQEMASLPLPVSVPIQEEETAPCPPGQEEYIDASGDKACCDPQDIWMVRLGNKVYTICGVLHGPENKTKEVSPPIDIEDSPELEQLSMATPSKSLDKPPSPHRCQQLFTTMKELREKIERTQRFLTRARTYTNVLQKRKQTRKLTTRLINLRKSLTKRVRLFQSGCVPTVLPSNSPAPASQNKPITRHRTTILKKSRAGLIRSLLLSWLALTDAPKLINTTSRTLVPYYHYVNLDRPTDLTVHIVPADDQQTGSYGTTAPFRGAPPVVNMGSALVPIGPLRTQRVPVPNEQQRGFYGTAAPFRPAPPVVNMGSAVVPVSSVRTQRVLVPNEQQRGFYGTTAPFRPAPPVVNMGSAVVPVDNVRNLPVSFPNEEQRGSYGTNAPYAPPENIVVSNTSGTGRFITENGKTYFVQEISWAGTRYKIKVFVDKDTTGRQLYDKVYEALRDQIGMFSTSSLAIRFKGKVDTLTNIEGKIISRNNTKIL